VLISADYKAEAYFCRLYSWSLFLQIIKLKL